MTEKYKSEELAKMANKGIDCLKKSLFLQGYASLEDIEKATVLKVIGQELERAAWRIVKKEGDEK